MTSCEIADQMWRRYSLSKQKPQKMHTPKVIYDRRVFGGVVYYRVLCHHHSGQQIKEWLPLSFLSQKHMQMVADFDSSFACLFDQPAKKGRLGREIVDCSIRQNAVTYKLEDGLGNILQVDANYLCSQNMQRALVQFLEHKNYFS